MTTPNQKLVGVRGWLLFFCIGLTIFSPLYILTDVTKELQIGASNAVALDLIQLCLSIMVGVMLWTRNSYAVTAARIYLAAMLVLSGGCLAIVLAAGTSITSMQPDDVKAVVQNVVGSLIWLAYLQFSKRVRLTFAPAPAVMRPVRIEPTLTRPVRIEPTL
jgi:hypothetical protein